MFGNFERRTLEVLAERAKNWPFFNENSNDGEGEGEGEQFDEPEVGWENIYILLCFYNNRYKNGIFL